MIEFKISHTIKGEVVAFKIEGSIDEDASFPPVGPQFKRIEFDLSAVHTINSLGIREWLNWIQPIAETGVEIVLEKCPKAIVYQFNMVEGFLPANARVVSFYVPFVCEACDREASILLTLGKEVRLEGGQVKLSVDARSAASFAKCTSDSCRIEMDVIEAKYFQFLKRAA